MYEPNSTSLACLACPLGYRAIAARPSRVAAAFPSHWQAYKTSILLGLPLSNLSTLLLTLVIVLQITYKRTLATSFKLVLN